jgi:hypothetical protein
MLEPPEPLLCLPSPLLGPFPILWNEWPRCHIRRQWMHVIRSETVEVAMEAISMQGQTETLDEHVCTRAERAHWRLAWEQRLVRNARPATAPSVTITLHGLPASLALTYGFDLLLAA